MTQSPYHRSVLRSLKDLVVLLFTLYIHHFSLKHLVVLLFTLYIQLYYSLRYIISCITPYVICLVVLLFTLYIQLYYSSCYIFSCITLYVIYFVVLLLTLYIQLYYSLRYIFSCITPYVIYLVVLLITLSIQHFARALQNRVILQYRESSARFMALIIRQGIKCQCSIHMKYKIWARHLTFQKKVILFIFFRKIGGIFIVEFCGHRAR